MNFNIITEPWIPVRFLNGELKELGVKDVFEQAHLIEKIEDVNIKYVYGILNLLLAFSYNIYPLRTITEKGQLLEKEKFEVSDVESYIRKCEEKRKGCFDLFGENPFYQIKRIDGDKRKESMIGKIALDYPSGNNGVHFVPKVAVGKVLDCKEFTKALCSYSLFQAVKDATNSASGVNGGLNYPLYMILSGKNLFSTIVLNMITEFTWKQWLGENAKYLGNVVWENDTVYTLKEKTNQVSLVEGLTFQNRFVTIKDAFVKEDKIYIKSIYFGSGRVFEKYITRKTGDKLASAEDSLWRQPNGIYYTKDVELGKKKDSETVSVLKLLTAQGEKPIWQQMHFFFNENTKYRTPIVSEYEQLKMEDYITDTLLIYNIYYNSLSDGQYPPLQEGVYTNTMPLSVLENKRMLNNFNKLVNFVIDMGKVLRSELFEDSKQVSKLQNIYYSLVEKDYLPKIIAKFGNVEEITEETLEEIQKYSYDVVSDLKKLINKIYLENVSQIYSTQYFKIKVGADKEKKVGYYSLINNERRKINGTLNKLIKEKGYSRDESE